MIRHSSLTLSALGLALVLLLPSPAHAEDPPEGAPEAPVKAEVPAGGKVVKVYDGDTITLASGDKVRLRGVNTPELRPAEAYGKEARDAAAKLLMGQEITLSYGPGEKRDGYGRLVASVRCDGVDLATMLVENGLGHIFQIPPDNLDIAPLLEKQTAARVAKKGIWSDPRYQGTLHITSFHANGRGEDARFVNGEYFRVANITDGPVNLAGYSVLNINNKRFDLPEVSIPAGHTVQIHSGKGKHQSDPGQQLKVYLGSETPVFDNQRDRVTILNKDAEVVDQRDHAVQGN
ncbi:MAG: thermonuclease family protein [Deltaproteobacteria bacterium]|nr:thermonuclease family protein [Deltaproteobacteria bacterium]